MHGLVEAASEGHCALPKEALIERAGKLLEIDTAIVREALERSLLDGDLVEEKLGARDLVYSPAALRRAEECLAGLIRKLAGAPGFLPPIHVEKQLPGARARLGKNWQRHRKRPSAKLSQSLGLVAITGGPGVGKTTLPDSVFPTPGKLRRLLCAPTGRAAKRLMGATGLEQKPFTDY